jgi:hypothetical protein
MRQWAPLVAARAPFASFDVNFILRWIEVESAGNPCAVGKIGVNGPDGNPREMGLGQIYNPDDLKTLGASGDELRAYCIPGTQKLSRPLTASEMDRQVALTIALAVKCRNAAIADYRSVGGAWAELTPRDQGKFTKLRHGLPVLSRQGHAVAKVHYGRPAANWGEFTAAVAHSPIASTGDDSDRARILGNAEKTGQVIP